MRTRKAMRRCRTVPKHQDESVAPLVFWIGFILGACCLGEILARIRW
jgi:hypothetical protein